MKKPLLLIASLATFSQLTNAQTAFTNPAAITINDDAAATPYPSNLVVSGMPGVITNLTVTINSFAHDYPNDVSYLLQAPTGETYLLQSAVTDGTPVSGVTYTFSDAGATQLSQSGALMAGTYKPTNYMMDIWPAPAPLQPPGAGTYFIPGPWGVPLSAPASTFASVFNGLAPNGTWKLFVADFGVGDAGQISSGWTLNITTQTALSTQEIDFNAIKKDAKVDLSFSTQNHSFQQFEIQHSLDGTNFTDIKKFSKDEHNSYTYTYTMGNNTINYFRVKCSDVDGKVTYSQVKRIANSVNGKAVVFPTRFSSSIQVDFENEDSKELVLYNSVGVRVYKTSTDATSIKLPVSSLNLSAGIYYLQVISQGESHIYPLTKVND